MERNFKKEYIIAGTVAALALASSIYFACNPEIFHIDNLRKIPEYFGLEQIQEKPITNQFTRSLE